MKLLIGVLFLSFLTISSIGCGGGADKKNNESVKGDDVTGGDGTATLTWSAPTENSDNTSLTNLNNYNLYFGSEKTYKNKKENYKLSRISVNHETGSNNDENLMCRPSELRNQNDDPEQMICTVALADDTNWFFSVTAVNDLSIRSKASQIKCKSFTSSNCESLISVIEDYLQF